MSSLLLFQGLLILSHYPFDSTPEWYDATLDEWENCTSVNCQCKNFQTVLTPPEFLCTCILLDDGRLFAAGGCRNGKGIRSANMFDSITKKWIHIRGMFFERIKPYIIQLGWRVFVVNILFNITFKSLFYYIFIYIYICICLCVR